MSTIIDYRPARILPDNRLLELADRYDLRIGSNRVRRAYYATTSGQTGSAINSINLVTPEDAFIFAIGMGVSLDCSPASVPTNLSVRTECLINLGTYTTMGWGAFGSDSDRYCVGNARLDQEGLDVYEDLWDAPLIAGVGTGFQFDFAVSTQVATVWSIFQKAYVDFLPVKRI